MLLQIDKIQIAYGSHILLDEASMSIQEGERIGLIGRNGLGKTSLFQSITGQLEPHKGQVVTYKHCRPAYMRQESALAPNTPVDTVLMGTFGELLNLEMRMRELETRMADDPSDMQVVETYGEVQHRFEELGGYELDTRINTVLAGLGLPHDARRRTIGQLSGGQVNRLNIASIILSGANLLFLDEPTNHLDLEAIEWLEKYLAAFDGAFLLISHDRTFLNRTVTKIIEIEAQHLEFYAGNYDAYRLERIERRLRQQKLFDRQKSEIDRLEDFVRRNIAGQNTMQAQSRRKALKKLDRLSAPPSEIGVMKFRLDTGERGPDSYVRFKGVGFGYPGQPPLFKNLDLEIRRGQKIGLIGPNGAGKTTLMKMITGDLQPTEGEVMVGDAVKWHYLDQHMSHLDRERTAMEVAWDSEPQLTKGQMMGAMGAFLFSGPEVEKKVRNLSGGEKARLAFLKLQLEKPNLILADEPTNHLDIPTRETFEDAIAGFEGTLLAISHDRYFLDEVVDQVWKVENGEVKIYLGDYSDYEYRRDQEIQEAANSAMAAETARQARESAKAAVRPASPPSDKQKKREMEKLEREIDELETRIAALDARMADPANAQAWAKLNEWAEEKRKLGERLAQLMSRWEQTAAGS